MITKVLKNINGLKGNNDVVFVGRKESPLFNVIYFGGDIQDLQHKMKNYINYSLESTASLLHNRYEQLHCNVHVYAVRPSEYKYPTFSIFKNFVEMIHDGHPVFKSDPLLSCANQLYDIIHSSAEVISSDKEADVVAKANVPFHLIGFSKGCAVLTQLLYDLSGPPSDSRISGWFANMRHIKWLDSGHNGGAELWPISSKLVDNFLTTYDCCLHGFATPFQMKRFGRDRSPVEYNQFAGILAAHGAKHRCEYLLQDHDNDLETHFNVLNVFPLLVD